MNFYYNYEGPEPEGIALGLNAWANRPNRFYTTSDPVGLCLLNLQEYHIPTGAVRLSENIHTEYDPVSNGKVRRVDKYFYDDSLHENPMRFETHDSKGNWIKTETKYPYDYPGVAVYDTMAARNIINKDIEQVKTNVNLNKELSLRRTNYGFWDGDLQIKPTSVQISINGNIPGTRLRFNAYDEKGNVLEQQKESDVRYSYIWGYKNAYPIAEVENAERKDIFHTSFEDSEGNSTVGDCKTGKRSRIGGFNKSLSGLSNTNYVLSYWLKSGDDWSLQSTIITITTGSYTININGQIDEVRFYPTSARMTTYTYEPLVGITSTTDANDRSTYYKYDELGRLKLVLDDENNIVKTIRYHHANGD